MSVDLRVSHYMPEDHGTHGDFIAPWARAVETLSGGVAHVTVHSGGSSLGKLEHQYDQVVSGAVDVAHSPAHLPPGRFPRTTLIGLPFLASGAASGGALLQGLLERFLRTEFAGLHVLALHADSGAVLHTRDRPVARLEDLAGLRLRCAPGVMAEALACLGAVPVPLAPPQIEAAVAARTIDGAVMAWDVLAYTRTADALRCHVDTALNATPLYFAMNAARYAALPEPVRAAVDAASRELAPRFPGWWRGWEARGRALAQGPWHHVDRLEPGELARWRQVAAPALSTHLDALRRGAVPEAWDIYRAAVAMLGA